MAPKRKAAEQSPTTGVGSGEVDQEENAGEDGSQAPQPKAEPGEGMVEIHLQGQEEGPTGENRVTYRVKGKVVLQKIIDKYVEKTGKTGVKLYKDGKQLNPKKTVADAGLKNGAVVGAYTHQIAG